MGAVTGVVRNEYESIQRTIYTICNKKTETIQYNLLNHSGIFFKAKELLNQNRCAHKQTLISID
jgi:hypothetical protein